MIEQGSFSAAARALGRAQSAVTYAIKELEADLGLPLFDRSGYRPELSNERRVLLPRARRVLHEAGALQMQAAGMVGGLEAELTIVIDPHFPMGDLTGALAGFEERFPSVTRHLYVEALGRPVEMVVDETTHLGLVVAAFAEAEGIERHHAGWLHLVPVCAPGHPLASRLDGPAQR